MTKLIRSTEDALTDIFFKDDSQIVATLASKVYVNHDPGAVIIISTTFFNEELSYEHAI